MFKPLSRKEIFQHAIATGKESPIEPLTREEMLMAEHAKREASGGSGGGSDVLRVIFTYEGYDEDGNTSYTATCDKTFAEIAKAYETGLFDCYMLDHVLSNKVRKAEALRQVGEDTFAFFFGQDCSIAVSADGTVEVIWNG